MKVLVFGANGFLGQEIVRELKHTGHSVIAAIDQRTNRRVDLLDKESIEACLISNKPNVVINCAGIVENTDKAAQNPQFTLNILEAIANSHVPIERVIISGSAAEYGEVKNVDEPVKESAQLNAASLYGKSKVEETQGALRFGKRHNISVVIARIFNPIGNGMNQKFLISRILEQIEEIGANKRDAIEVNRLDAKRDYIDVRDVASAVTLLVDNAPAEQIYNIGSGKATTNQELIRAIINSSDMQVAPTIRETSSEPEPNFASQADISRLKREFGWTPQRTLEETVKEILASGK